MKTLMKEHERAAQLWPLLVLAARTQQVLSYTTVRRLTGIATVAVGGCLGHILTYCMVKKWPWLPSIVVNEPTGLPGESFMNAARKEYGNELDMFAMRSRVFAYDWCWLHSL
jgi:hypothetical protein